MMFRRRLFRNSIAYTVMAVIGFCMCFGMTALGKQLNRVVINGYDVSGLSCSEAAEFLCDEKGGMLVFFWGGGDVTLRLH